MSQWVEVRVPDIGDFHDVEVIEVLVAPGDVVVPDQSLITLESDKATMEIPAPRAGVVRELAVAVGGRVSRRLADPAPRAGSRGGRRPRSGRARAASAAPAGRADARRERARAGVAAEATGARTSSCSARGPEATPPRFEPPISASTWCSSSATKNSAACA